MTLTTRIGLIAAALGTGMFAGLLFTFMIGVEPMQAAFDAANYTASRQQLIRLIDAGIPYILIPATLGPIIVLVGLRKQVRSPLFILTALAFLIFILGVMAYTILLNVPINNYVLTWDLSAPPADWMQARANWEALNTPRTFISIASFTLYLIALSSPLRQENI